MTSSLADVCVILVNYRLAGEIDTLLSSGACAGAHVLLLDNASEPEAITELGRRHGAEVMLLDDNHGFAGAVNRGLRITREPFVLLLNPDVSIPDGGIARLLTFLESTQSDAVTPLLVDEDGVLQVGTAGGWSNPLGVAAYFFFVTHMLPRVTGIFFTRRQLLGQAVPRWVCMACCLMRRETVIRYGLLPEAEFMYAEDVAWGERITSGGGMVNIDRELIVTHVGGAAGHESRGWHESQVRMNRRTHGRSGAALVQWTIATGLELRRLARRVPGVRARLRPPARPA
jgi:N-acetylglucosaminyl-diphospho-decaprenol L-rhamnosyltransferase